MAMAGGTPRRPGPWVTRALLGLVAIVIAGGLTGCDPAPPNPILVVGGHTTQVQDAQAYADHLGDLLPYADYDDPAWTAGVELASAPGKDFPFDSGYTDWPGSALSADSEGAILASINDLYAATGNTPIDIVAISQGAPTVRALLQRNPDNVRGKVAGYISLSGVNAGVPEADLINTLGCLFYQLPVCGEIVYPANPDRPGETSWLRDSVNKPSGSGPVPGAAAIDYYHVYTAVEPGGATTDLFEGARPYGWSVPLLGATNVSVQDECPSRQVAHANVLDPVVQELVLDALDRRALDYSGSCTA